MNRSRRLRLFFYLNILLIISLIGYKVYLMVAEPYFEAVHALQVERIEELLELCEEEGLIGRAERDKMIRYAREE